MLCSFSNLENENILLTGWWVFLDRSIFYPFMSEARQINGFWNLFPMLILFPKFQERRDRSTVLSLRWEKEVASVPALSSELPARVSGSTIHPLLAHPVSWQSGPESPFLPM